MQWEREEMLVELQHCCEMQAMGRWFNYIEDYEISGRTHGIWV